MITKTTIIYTAQRIDDAQLLANTLIERGIEAVIENEALQGGVGGLPPGVTTAPQIRVAAEDAQKARQVVAEFERQLHFGPLQTDERSQPSHQSWHDWPVCPSCGQRRQTQCPVCQVSSDNFHLAEFNDIAPSGGDGGGEESPLPLLMCPTCDEAFTPRFYRACPWCNHQFEKHGLEAGSETASGEEFSPRMLAVLMGLVALTMGLMAYFWWIGQR